MVNRFLQNILNFASSIPVSKILTLWFFTLKVCQALLQRMGLKCKGRDEGGEQNGWFLSYVRAQSGKILMLRVRGSD